MITLDLITKQDLEQFKIDLLRELKNFQVSTSASINDSQWLRSPEVRKLLKISPGTLQNLRINGTLAYTQIGNIHYYKYDDIVKLLDSGNSKSLK